MKFKEGFYGQSFIFILIMIMKENETVGIKRHDKEQWQESKWAYFKIINDSKKYHQKRFSFLDER